MLFPAAEQVAVLRDDLAVEEPGIAQDVDRLESVDALHAFTDVGEAPLAGREGIRQLIDESAREILAQRGQAVFRLDPRGGRLVLAGDVAEDEHDAPETPVRRANGRGAVVDLALGSVAGNQHGVVRQGDHGALFQDTFHRIRHRLARADMDNGENLAQGTSQRLAGRPAGQHFGHMVHAGDATADIGGDDAFADRFKRDGQILLAVAKLFHGLAQDRRHQVQLEHPARSPRRGNLAGGDLLGVGHQTAHGTRHPPGEQGRRHNRCRQRQQQQHPQVMA